jgi:DNA-binding SARP family transcriptional activator
MPDGAPAIRVRSLRLTTQAAAQGNVITSPHVLQGAAVGSVLGLLSGFELRHRGVALAVPGSAQRLLAFLALQSRPILRVYVAGCLWLDSDEEHANASLRSALWRLHRLRPKLVRSTNSHLALAPGLDVDVRTMSVVARALLERDAAPSKSDIASLCGAGELLPDWYDDWLVIERERFRQLRLHALDAACRRLTRAARYPEAVEVGLAAIAGEPLRESAHRALIEVHLAEGNVCEAVRQLDAYRRLVAVHLGAEPSRELEQMVACAATRR